MCAFLRRLGHGLRRRRFFGQFGAMRTFGF
jgi:hypothetical protein